MSDKPIKCGCAGMVHPRPPRMLPPAETCVYFYTYNRETYAVDHSTGVKTVDLMCAMVGQPGLAGGVARRTIASMEAMGVELDRRMASTVTVTNSDEALAAKAAVDELTAELDAAKRSIQWWQKEAARLTDAFDAERLRNMLVIAGRLIESRTKDTDAGYTGAELASFRDGLRIAVNCLEGTSRKERERLCQLGASERLW